MKEEQFFEAFSNIDPQFIEETKIRIPKKRSRKILWRVITGLIAVLLIICAVYPLMRKNPYYSIRQIDGEYYLVSKMKQQEHPLSTQSIVVYFDSVQEMHDDMIQCNFIEPELNKLKTLLHTHVKIAIPNLDNLSQPVFPDDFVWSGRVLWFGDSYYLFFLDDKHPSCIVIPGDTYEPCFWAITESDYYEALSKEFKIPEGSEILSVEQIDDRDATVYYTLREDGAKITYMFYTIQDGDKKMHIKETIVGEQNTIDMYIHDGDLYGYLADIYSSNRPSVEWLSSFGLEPYETNP